MKMMGKSRKKTLVCLLSSLVLLMIYGGYDITYADASFSSSFTMTNKNTSNLTADYLYFEIRLRDSSGNLEGANAGSPYWFKSYALSYTFPPATLNPIVNVTVQANPDGHTYGLDITCTNLVVAYDKSVTVSISGVLNAWNALSCESILWANTTSTTTWQGSLDKIFYYPFQEDIVVHGVLHDTSYSMRNSSTQEMNVLYLQVYFGTEWLEPELQWMPMDNLIEEIVGPVTIFPLDNYTVPLNDLPNLPESYIYVAGALSFEVPGSEPMVMQFRDGHEEELPLDDEDEDEDMEVLVTAD